MIDFQRSEYFVSIATMAITKSCRTFPQLTFKTMKKCVKSFSI